MKKQKRTSKKAKVSFLQIIKSKKYVIFAAAFALMGGFTLYLANAQSTTFSGKLWSENSTDTYRISSPAAGTITANLSRAPKSGTESAKLTLKLKNSSGSVLASSTATSYDAPVTLSKSVSAGTYYFEVTSATRLTWRGINFNLSVQYPNVTKDTLAPLVAIQDSDLLANVKGSVLIKGTSSDTNGIKITRLIVDGVVKSSATTGSTWSFNLDTTKYSDGAHVLTVESEDPSGNKGKSSITLNVDNTPPEDSGAGPEDPTTPPSPTPTPDTSSFLSGDVLRLTYNADNRSGWAYEESGATERLVERADVIECYAGGYDASTHYARVRRKLPERDNFRAQKRFSVESTFELPDNFYTQHQSYMRLITTDNYPANLSGSGTKVGAASGDEWRVGFTIYGSDGLFRLISEHENHSNIVLWKNSSKLPVGKHTVKINFAPSKSNTGAWELYVDGKKVGSGTNVQTVPSSLAQSEIVVTRVGGCIDGAASQDSKVIQANLHSVTFAAER